MLTFFVKIGQIAGNIHIEGENEGSNCSIHKTVDNMNTLEEENCFSY